MKPVKEPSRRVLVTAGSEKQSLAAVRSLGRSGFHVDVCDSQPNAPAQASRYCDRALRSPSNLDRRAYLAFLQDTLQANDYLTVLPCDDVTARYLSQERQWFSRWTRLALPPQPAFERATDKGELVRLAEDIGVPVPRTRFPSDLHELETQAAEIGFPLILKGSFGWGAQHVGLVKHADQLAGEAERIAGLENGRLPMLQEFIPGTGYGFTALYRHGAPRALFMHRRAAEYDVQSDGKPYSCPAASSVDEPDLRRQGLKLFEHLQWHGIGMSEWRRDARNGRFVLMEINPRLVGSTDLAIQSGVDFPTLACRLLLEGDIDSKLHYDLGVRLRWMIPDGLADFLARPRQALGDSFENTRTDWCWRDLTPHWKQFRLAAWELRQRRRSG